MAGGETVRVERKIAVAVLGATGVVGQRFVRRLAAHPWFAIGALAASERSAGKRYAEACDWRLPGEAWAGLGETRLGRADPADCPQPVVFSALDRTVAAEVEPRFAAAGALVFSNAAAFRMEEDVPLLVPEANPDHLELLAIQRRARGWSGGIVTNPNCTTAVAVGALAPLERAFGIEAVFVASLQAASGAGHPGVSSLDLLGNVIPFIRDEEEKVEGETRKLLGRLREERIEPARFEVSAACHRVPVLDGHTEAIALRLGDHPTPEAVARVLIEFRGEPQRLGLPSAPARPVIVHFAPDRPQPRLDAEAEGGMPVHVGRIRACPVFGIKLVALGHNVERGAAGASVLNAELAVARGLLAPA